MGLDFSFRDSCPSHWRNLSRICIFRRLGVAGWLEEPDRRRHILLLHYLFRHSGINSWYSWNNSKLGESADESQPGTLR